MQESNIFSNMPTRLMIVESPAKCAKIQSFLGDGWKVLASMGHIRGLKEKLEAVGIDSGWDPIYEDHATKKDQIAKLRKAAKEADEVWLSTDPDREGEGIAWHLCHILKLNPLTTPRITFQEITKTAILNAVANPGRLDMNMANAQQARAMLDMLVGFTISRCLWKKVAPKLSAGRCQTPALRLVSERDAEIAGHTARNYWVLKAKLATSQSLSAPLLDVKTDGEWIESKVRETLAQTTNKSTETKIRTVKERLATSNAPAPLITSTLQQEASALHGLNPKATMMAAQKLYEAGHITYMRTDNPHISVEAADAMRALIAEGWSAEYVGPAGQHQVSSEPTTTQTPVPKKGKKKADKGIDKVTDKVEAPAVEGQNAHEAIRPTHPDVQYLDVEHSQQVVYKLVWRRAMQSQMAAAKTHVRTATFQMETLPSLTWSGEQTKPAFDGWHALDKSEKTKETEQSDEAVWAHWTSHLVPDTTVHWSSLHADEVFTKPPGRYTEATLIRELEKKGIGRPSTFASLVTTLFDRNYVEKTNKEGQVYETRHLSLPAKAKVVKEVKETHKAGAEKNKIAATSLGVSVMDYLGQDFNDLFAYDFTAHMEATLDQIAKGEKPWKEILQETWDTYKERYTAIQSEKGDTRAKQIGTTTASEEAVVKLIQTKLGPRLVRPKADGTGDEFASLPEGITFTNAEKKLTEELVESAFETAKTARDGEEVGMWLTHPILKKRGPFGSYVESDGIKVPWKSEDTQESLVAKLLAKKDAFERKVGEWTIKQGPYGLYFYKPNPKGKKGPPKFHKFPADTDPATITSEILDTVAAAPKGPARRPPPKKKQ